MDIERAKQIAVSPVMANVRYNGSPVYIENVNDTQKTADIHLISMPSSKKRIPVASLIELSI